MNTRFTLSQRLAFYIAKNHIYDAFEVLRIYKKALAGDKFESTLKNMAEKYEAELDNELAAIADSGIKMVFYGEKGYPKALLDLHDAPVMLFIKSKTEPDDLFNSREKAYKAIVGTRDIDSYGVDTTQALVERLRSTDENTVVVSGLAIGVDTEAHKTAIEHNLMTIAVLPTYFDSVYPSCNRRLAEILTSADGCALVTPFPPGTEPAPVNFLHRNRIIAGLCDSTTVVEAKIKGGAIHTARLAFSYQRNIYAVPGRLGDVRSEGCNMLIKTGIAEIITL